SVGDESFISLDAEGNFRAGRNQNHFGTTAFAGRVCKHVAAAPCAFGGRVLRPVERRQSLAAEYEHGGFVLESHDEAPRLDALVRVGGAEDEEAGDCAKACQLFDGLMRRAVFTDADGVVCEDVYGRDFHYRADTY